MWRADGRELYYQGAGLMAVPVQTSPTLRVGEPHKVFDKSPAIAGVTPDGQRFLTYSRRTTSGAPQLQVILNWFEELERLAPHPR
jgi:hypothetical protein